MLTYNAIVKFTIRNSENTEKEIKVTCTTTNSLDMYLYEHGSLYSIITCFPSTIHHIKNSFLCHSVILYKIFYDGYNTLQDTGTQ